MKNKSRAAAVIIKNKKLLLFHRHKDGEVYYVLPGGGIEKNESPEEAVIREVKEELNLEVKNPKKLFEFTNLGHREYYYLIKEFSGKLKAIGDSEGGGRIKDEVVWCNYDDLKEIRLLPEKAKTKLLKFFKELS